MKKQIKIVALVATLIIAVSTIVFVGCKKEDLVNQNNTEKKVEKGRKRKTNNFSLVDNNPFSFVGEYHNQGLDYMINNIDENVFLSLFSEDEAIFKDEVFQKTKIFSSTIDWIREVEFEDEDLLFESMNDEISIDLSEFLSQPQIEMWNNLTTIIFEDDEEKSVYQVEELCYDFNNEVSTIDDEMQQTILYLASAVLLSSYSYWYNEFASKDNSLWFRYIDEQFVAENLSFGKQGEDIVKADAEGALGGAVMGAVKGAVGGSVVPGAGTLTGGIAGALVGAGEGALVASTVKAGINIGKTVRHWFRGVFETPNARVTECTTR